MAAVPAWTKAFPLPVTFPLLSDPLSRVIDRCAFPRVASCGHLCMRVETRRDPLVLR